MNKKIIIIVMALLAGCKPTKQCLNYEVETKVKFIEKLFIDLDILEDNSKDAYTLFFKFIESKELDSITLDKEWNITVYSKKGANSSKISQKKESYFSDVLDLANIYNCHYDLAKKTDDQKFVSNRIIKAFDNGDGDLLIIGMNIVNVLSHNEFKAINNRALLSLIAFDLFKDKMGSVSKEERGLGAQSLNMRKEGSEINDEDN